jgi:hypothetical protein
MTPKAKFRDLEIHCSKFGDLSDTRYQLQGPPVNFSRKRIRAPLLDLTIGCLPHHVYKHKEQQQLQESCYALEINGDHDDQEHGGASVAYGAESRS